MCEVVKQLEGAYALLIKSSVYPGELVACRRGSPLILGMKYGIQVRLEWCLWARPGKGWQHIGRVDGSCSPSTCCPSVSPLAAGGRHAPHPPEPQHPADSQADRHLHARPPVLRQHRAHRRPELRLGAVPCLRGVGGGGAHQGSEWDGEAAAAAAALGAHHVPSPTCRPLFAVCILPAAHPRPRSPRALPPAG